MSAPLEDERQLNHFFDQPHRSEHRAWMPGFPGWCIGIAISLGGYAALVLDEQLPGCCLALTASTPDAPVGTSPQAAHPVSPSLRP